MFDLPCKSGKCQVAGIPVFVENPVGTCRTGVDRDGMPWMTIMKNSYGHIPCCEGADGEYLDVYIGDYSGIAGKAYVVKQRCPFTGKYDEDKVMLGFLNQEQARCAYLEHYNRPDYLGKIVAVPMDEFVRGVKAGRAPWMGKVKKGGEQFTAKWKIRRERREEADLNKDIDRALSDNGLSDGEKRATKKIVKMEIGSGGKILKGEKNKAYHRQIRSKAKLLADHTDKRRVAKIGQMVDQISKDYAAEPEQPTWSFDGPAQNDNGSVPDAGAGRQMERELAWLHNERRLNAVHEIQEGTLAAVSNSLGTSQTQ